MNLKQLVLKYKKKTVILILLIIAAAGADIYAGYTLAWYYDIAVSYTHLDVYKRQERGPPRKAKYSLVTDSA